MKTLLLILVAAVVIAAVAFYFFHKMNLYSSGHRLDWSDGDSVTVNEDELQEFMFEMQATEEMAPVIETSEVIVSRGHAIA